MKFSIFTNLRTSKLPFIDTIYTAQSLFVPLFLLKRIERKKLNKKCSFDFATSVLEKFKEAIIIYRKAGDEVTFPVKTTARNGYEINLAARIRKKICQYYIEAEILIRWYLFQLELDQLHRSFKSSIVSLSTCFEIGMTLQMNYREVHAALAYYHDLTIFLYFPKVLPNMAFLERLSDLINFSFADAVDHLEGGGISLYNPAAHEKLNDEGFIFITRIQS